MDVLEGSLVDPNQLSHETFSVMRRVGLASFPCRIIPSYEI